MKLNANAHEFVPRSKNDDDDLQAFDKLYPNVNAMEFVPRLQKEATTQVNADTDEELEAVEEPLPIENLMLPWKGFPKRPMKGSEEVSVCPFLTLTINIYNLFTNCAQLATAPRLFSLTTKNT